jgi:hypothetical protein
VWSSWSWLYGSWIDDYLCNQCLSPLTLSVRIPFRRGVLDTALCDQVCQWLLAGRSFSPSTPVSSTTKADRHNITDILLKVALNTIILTPIIPGKPNTMNSYKFVHGYQFSWFEERGIFPLKPGGELMCSTCHTRRITLVTKGYHSYR